MRLTLNTKLDYLFVTSSISFNLISNSNLILSVPNALFKHRKGYGFKCTSKSLQYQLEATCI